MFDFATPPLQLERHLHEAATSIHRRSGRRDQLCRQAKLIGVSLELLPPWFDVDEPEDLERLNLIGEPVGASPRTTPQVRGAGSPELIAADSPATRVVLGDFARR